MFCRSEDGVSKEKNIPLYDELIMVSSYFQISPQRSKKEKHRNASTRRTDKAKVGFLSVGTYYRQSQLALIKF